jgi:hypothetical protein
MAKMKEDPLEVVYHYTRGQAIADGVLVDLTGTARTVGIKFPMAITSAVYFGYIAQDPAPPTGDLASRLWDLLAAFKAAVAAGDGSAMEFKMRVVKNARIVASGENPVEDYADNWRLTEVTLQAVCGPGDDPRPVITIMTLDED